MKNILSCGIIKHLSAKMSSNVNGRSYAAAAAGAAKAGGDAAAPAAAAAPQPQRASEMVYSTVAHGKQRVEEVVVAAKHIASDTTKRFDDTRTTICRRATEYVDAGKEKVDMVRTKVSPVLEEGKVRAASISSNAKKAISTRDVHVVVTIMAQIVAVVFIAVSAIVSTLCSYDRVDSAIKRMRTMTVVQHLEDAVRSDKIKQAFEKIPKIGAKMLDLFQTFIMEVKKNV